MVTVPPRTVFTLDTGSGTGDWRAFRYFGLYRCVLATILVILVILGASAQVEELASPRSFRVLVFGYAAFAAMAMVAILWRWGGFDRQVVAQMVLDILLLSGLLHLGGGVASGFGLLLVVAVAACGILVGRRLAVSFAAAGTLLVLGQQFLLSLRHVSLEPSYAHAGALGIALFAGGLILSGLAARLRVTEALVARRDEDLASLAALNEHIVQRMQAGVAVLDPRGGLRLMNRSAEKLLGLGAWHPGQSLRSVSEGLADLERQWRQNMDRSSHLLKPSPQSLSLVVSFAAIGSDGEEGTVIFLEDAAATHQRAQQLKLASLGRLAGSIAHEIRNPLGAISHAGQLLAESEHLDDADRRLTRIISDNSARMNSMVENVMQLGQGRSAQPRSFELAPWLGEFVQEFLSRRPGMEHALRHRVEPQELVVRIDPSQLHQVLWNLCDNAVQHAGEPPRVRLEAGIGEHTRRPFLDVVDNGEGIGETDLPRVFEPFFTTRDEGTGLGLYIAREMCEGNQASLTLEPSQRGCRFRITFPDPRRKGVIS
jgi:two-component system sensor histidine kinase PilS (NtrC family)